ncbi:Hypothetical protein LUCI_2020 [Lucifera butyrica]|uniref:NlpC/P60 domain-containing protein n=1 Tax=Lucifera butyrica TaxID=1351585 RepID=A0A498R5Q4_9FIRM|nr:C40 family peptidase [Lucifera butyrica]VBB06784.1 Hypothetical protein LUCI_2020 [Lucifera butyrica]
MRRIFVFIICILVLASTLPAAYAADAHAGRHIRPTVVDGKTRGEKIVSQAMHYKGVPYRFGGASPKGFDCSGLVWYVFKQNGKKLPRAADKQFATGKAVKGKELVPGDVVFFSTYTKGASHCGIYMGGGKFIHASSSRGVTVTSLNDSYWKPRYLGARRMIEK